MLVAVLVLLVAALFMGSLAVGPVFLPPATVGAVLVGKGGEAARLIVLEIRLPRALLGLMIGGNVESILAMTTSACFAAGQGGFTFADLDTPLFMATNPFEGGFSLDGGNISVAHIKAGHGVTPLEKT